MSTLSVHKTGYSERELSKNWAAEYAKRLCDGLDEKLTEADGVVLDTAKQYSDNNLSAAKAYALSGITAARSDTLAAAKAYVDRDNAVSTNQLADGSVTKKKLADGAVTEEKLADVSVTNDKLGARSVTTGKILDKCITAAKLAEPSVTTEKLADGAVTAEKLSTSGVTNEKIKTGAVDARAIADGSITLSELSDALQSRLIIGCDNCGETSAIPHESGVYQWLGGTIQVTEDNTNNTTQTITTPGGIVLVSDCDGDIIEILFCGERDSYDSLEYAHPMQIYWRSLIHDYDTQDPVSYDPVPWMLVNPSVAAASINSLGGIKLYSSNGVNCSGLVVYDDGTTLVYTNPEYGITRSGDGKVITAPAATDEIFDGTNAYKPIVPAMFSQFIDYRKKPWQIGTWIDGTPIFRQVIPLTAITETGFILVREYLSCSKCTVLKSNVFVQNSLNDYSFEAYADKDTYSILYEGRGIYIKSLDEDEYIDVPKAWYGIVEFAAQESDF